MCSCESSPDPDVADPAPRAPADRTGASRRGLLLGGAALLATAAAPLAGAAAAMPVPPGAKPAAPFLYRLGRKPTPPARPGPDGAATPAALRPAPTGGPAQRTLTLDNINTGERLTVTYMENGRYLPDALAALNHLMRDRRTDAVAAIDPALFDLLCDIRMRLETAQPLQLISGYRAPETNARMRQRDRAVARKSYHTRGMAADIAVPGCSVATLRQVAVAMGRGGVGDYPRSGFVHVDVGPPRTW